MRATYRSAIPFDILAFGLGRTRHFHQRIGRLCKMDGGDFGLETFGECVATGSEVGEGIGNSMVA